jgi:hypothetical protein
MGGMRTSVLIAVAVLFVAANPMSGETAKPIKLKRVPIQEREQDYHYFKSTVISSDVEFATFFDKAAKQELWLHKDEFFRVLKDSKIDFRSNSLLLLRSTTGSGSIKVSLAEPNIVDDELVCRIEWRKPSSWTGDVAERCYALIVPKGIAKQVRIDSPNKRDVAVIKLPK